MAFVSVSEFEEYSEIANMFREKMKELRSFTKIVENIPYKQIAPTNYIKGKTFLYELRYNEVLTGINCSKEVSKYMFSEELLKQVVKVIKGITLKIQNELREYFKDKEFKYHSKECIEKYIKYIGYRRIIIEEKSERIEELYYNTPSICEMPNRIHQRWLKMEEKKYHEAYRLKNEDKDIEEDIPF